MSKVSQGYWETFFFWLKPGVMNSVTPTEFWGCNYLIN
jgi:hypothetical protein